MCIGTEQTCQNVNHQLWVLSRILWNVRQVEVDMYLHRWVETYLDDAYGMVPPC